MNCRINFVTDMPSNASIITSRKYTYCRHVILSNAVIGLFIKFQPGLVLNQAQTAMTVDKWSEWRSWRNIAVRLLLHSVIISLFDPIIMTTGTSGHHKRRTVLNEFDRLGIPGFVRVPLRFPPPLSYLPSSQVTWVRIIWVRQAYPRCG